MFLDTSELFAYHHVGEPHHEEALALFEAADRALTHGYVLAEFVALVGARRHPQPPALALVRRLCGHRKVLVVWVTESLHGEGMRLLEARPDKTYSLCDAISFVLMRHYGMTDALTNDRHFEQEGFRRLLR